MRHINEIIADVNLDEAEVNRYIVSSMYTSTISDIDWEQVIKHKRFDFLIESFKPYMTVVGIKRRWGEIIPCLLDSRDKIAHFARFMTPKGLADYVSTEHGLDSMTEITQTLGNSHPVTKWVQTKHLRKTRRVKIVDARSLEEGHVSVDGNDSDETHKYKHIRIDCQGSVMTIDDYIKSRTPEQIAVEIPWRELVSHKHYDFLLSCFKPYLTTNILSRNVHILADLFGREKFGTHYWFTSTPSEWDNDLHIDVVKLRHLAPFMTKTMVKSYCKIICKQKITAEIFKSLSPFLFNELLLHYLRCVYSDYADSGSTTPSADTSQHIHDLLETDKEFIGHCDAKSCLTLIEFAADYNHVIIDDVFTRKIESLGVKEQILRELDFEMMSLSMFESVVCLLDEKTIVMERKNRRAFDRLYICNDLIYNSEIRKSSLFPFHLFTPVTMIKYGCWRSLDSLAGRRGLSDADYRIAKMPFIKKFVHCVDKHYTDHKYLDLKLVTIFSTDVDTFEQLLHRMIDGGDNDGDADERERAYSYIYEVCSVNDIYRGYDRKTTKEYLNWSLEKRGVWVVLSKSLSSSYVDDSVKKIYDYWSERNNKQILHELFPRIASAIKREPRVLSATSTPEFMNSISYIEPEFQRYFIDIIDLSESTDILMKHLNFVRRILGDEKYFAARDGNIIANNMSAGEIAVSHIFHSQTDLLTRLDTVQVDSELVAKFVADATTHIGVTTEADVGLSDQIVQKAAKFIRVEYCTVCMCHKHEFLVQHTDSRGSEHVVCIGCHHKTIDKTRCTVCNITLPL